MYKNTWYNGKPLDEKEKKINLEQNYLIGPIRISFKNVNYIKTCDYNAYPETFNYFENGEGGEKNACYGYI